MSTGSTSANPPEFATPFDGKVWDLLEGKLGKLDDLNASEVRESIQEASKASEALLEASSSSASAGPSSEQQPPWENDAKFKHDLKYLAWMHRKGGDPAPVYVDPGTDNPMEVDYTIDE